MRNVTVSAVQMKYIGNYEINLLKAEKYVCDAAEKDGANIILLQELFETPYFCKMHNFKYYDLAKPVSENKAIKHMSYLAKKYHAVIPVSFYEKSKCNLFNSLAVINTDGNIIGIYRKTHIPDGMPYAEKFYFTPGDTGFKVWKTEYGTLGFGICWDQWFPEAARCMALLGAELLFYPTAIGSEPYLKCDSKEHWQNAMKGHAAANLIPVIAANRTGDETDGNMTVNFYGSSFICDGKGCITEQMPRDGEGVISHTFDLDELEKQRREWGIFRDRRPEMYKTILTSGV